MPTCRLFTRPDDCFRLHLSVVLLVSLVLGLGAGPVAAQDVIVDDDGQAALPANCGGSNSVPNTIDGGINNATAGDVIFVCPGTYTEQDTVDKSVTLEGNNASKAGYDDRNAETIVDAGTASPVDRTTNTAFTVQAEDVTIRGFQLKGNHGVVLDPSTVSSPAPNDGVGLTVQNNLIATDIVGVRIENVTTTGSKSFTITDNQFEVKRQSYDLVNSQEQSLEGDTDNTEGDEDFEYTASVSVRTIDGDQAPTLQDNVVTDDGTDVSGDGDADGSFYGYALDGVQVSSGPVTIAGDPSGPGGTIQGTAQGIAVLDGQSPRQSDLVIEEFSISDMSGSAPNNAGVGFHAGVFTFVTGDENSGQTTATVRNTTVEGLDLSDTGQNFSANINLSHFGSSNDASQNITLEGNTIRNTENRGIALAGGTSEDITATITDDASGDATIVKGVAAGANGQGGTGDGHAIHSEGGGSPTINNTTITNNGTEAEALHVRSSNPPATVTIGAEVTINANGQDAFGTQGGGGLSQESQIDVLDASPPLTVDGFRQSLRLGTAFLNIQSGADLILTGTGTNTQLDQVAGDPVVFNTSATPILSTGAHEAPNNASLPQVITQNPGSGDPALTGTDTLRITDRLTLSSGTFDVTNGHLTLAAVQPDSAASISGSGSGTINGDITVEWEVPSGYAGWQALTAPVDTQLDSTSGNPLTGTNTNPAFLLSNMWTQKSGSGTGYDAANGRISNSSVFDYDETASVGGNTTEDLNDAWFAPSDLSPTITQGQTSRLVFFFGDRDFDGTDESGSPFTLSATGSILDKENTNTDVDLGLTYTENDGGGDADGWNLVGNPFMAPLDWELVTGNGTGRTKTSRTVYIPKADGTYATYQADKNGKTGGTSTNGGSRYLSPFQGFFVKATGSSPSLTVKSDDKALNESPTLKQESPGAATVKLRMRAANSSRNEETVVRFAEEARPDANDGDAYQLKPLSNDYFYIASEIPDSSQAYEIQSLPPPAADTQAVPLELASAQSRTYVVDGTLSGIPSDWTVRLRDRKTGTTADLTRDESLSVALDGDASRNKAKAGDAERPSRTPAAPVVAPASGPATASTSKTAAESARVLLEVIPSGAVPIELTQFKGTMRENAVALSWATADKTRDARFHIQRSSSKGGPWTTLRVVRKSGTTSYRVTDNLAYETDTARYRLKVETDGTTQYSDPITVERDRPSTLRVRSLFPNPARSTLTIQYELPERTTVTMEVYDVLGRRISTVLNQPKEAGRHKRTISVTGLSSGIHFLRLRAASTVRTRKFVVVR